jgi:hypothetical protein
MEKKQENEKSLVFSYLTLRKTIGILGIALPFVLSLGSLIIFQTGFQSSLSKYYHTGMGNVFVGTLWVMGFFLFSYKGYSRKDDIAGDLACIFAIGAALFPTAPVGSTSSIYRIISAVHMGFSALFFVMLIYFALFLFTKTHEDKDKPPTRKKKQRDRVYKVCGYTMSICVLLVFVYALLPESINSDLKKLNPIYWLESLTVLAFGVSWFVKGEAILKDEI